MRATLIRLSAAVLAVGALAVPAEGVDCYPPGSCDTQPTNDYKSVPSLSVEVGKVKAETCRGRKCSDAKVSSRVDGGVLAIEASRRAMIGVRPVSPVGMPLQVGSDKLLTIPAYGGVAVTVSGMKSGSYADMYVNSSREFLGRVMVAANGTASATFGLGGAVDPDLHTLQVISTTSGGDILSVGVGVIVYNAALSASKPRYLFTKVSPGGGDRLKAKRSVDFSVELVDVKDGVLVSGHVAASLPACTVKVTVTGDRNRVLLPTTCLTSDGRGSASLTWTTPSDYQGKATVVYSAQGAGHVALLDTEQVSIQR